MFRISKLFRNVSAAIVMWSRDILKHKMSYSNNRMSIPRYSHHPRLNDDAHCRVDCNTKEKEHTPCTASSTENIDRFSNVGDLQSQPLVYQSKKYATKCGVYRGLPDMVLWPKYPAKSSAEFTGVYAWRRSLLS